MKRLLANTLMLVGGLTASSQLLALGLGELDLKSNLNQPLQAEIKLLDTEGLTDFEIKPALAKPADFERAGVERVYFLTKIKFEVKGDTVVLSTREPVNEPFLNFLVELNWPSGRALREYTLLLDPPTFQETSVQPLVNAPAGQTVTTAPAAQQQPAQPQVAAPATTNRWESEPAAPGTYKVQRNDTLWEIALQTRPNTSISAQQMMVALQEKNPQAFIGGNINRLKTHEVLRIPDAQEVRDISFRNAVAEVERQNKELTSGAQLDATGRAGSSAVSSGEQDGGEVRLLSAASDNSDSAGASGDAGTAIGNGRQQSLENDLAIALENVDKSRRENQELRERLEALEEQINTLQRLISLKDDQLATMQVDGAEVETPETGSDATDTAVAGETSGEVVAEGADESTAAATGSETSATDAEGAVDFNYAGGDAAEEPGGQSAEELAAAQEKEAREAAARRARIAAMMAEQEAQRAQPTLLETLLANPLVPAGGGVVLLLIALLIYRAVKGRKAAAKEDDEFSDEELMALNETDALDEDSLDNFDFEDDPMAGEAESYDEDEFAADLEPETAAEDFETVAQTEDVISESDIYIAYGKFEQAIELLQDAIEKEPSRSDLRLKLLEVYVEMDEASGFAEAESELRKLGDREASAQAEQMRGRLSAPIALGAVAAVAADDMLSLDGEIPSLDDSDDFSDGLDFGDALDLSGDLGDPVLADDKEDDTFDLDSDPVAEAGAGLEEVPTLDLDDGLEFDLGGDEPEAEEEMPEIADFGSDDDGLEFDLSGLSAEAEEEKSEAPASAEAPVADDDNALDFDLSGLETLGGEEEPEETAAPVEDDAVTALDFDLTSGEETTGSDDLSDLESLLDSDEEGADDLPDLSFDLSGDLDSDSDAADDLASLESELDSLASEPVVTEESVAEESVSEESGAEESTDDGLDFSADLDDLDAEISGLGESEAEDIALDVPELNDVPELTDVPQLDDVPELNEASEPADFTAEEMTSDAGEIDLDALAAADDEFDFLAGTDECATKLDLARAYIDMEDFDGAKELLQEVVQEGSDQQKSDARSMMDSLS